MSDQVKDINHRPDGIPVYYPCVGGKRHCITHKHMTRVSLSLTSTDSYLHTSWCEIRYAAGISAVEYVQAVCTHPWALGCWRCTELVERHMNQLAIKRNFRAY